MKHTAGGFLFLWVDGHVGGKCGLIGGILDVGRKLKEIWLLVVVVGNSGLKVKWH